MHTFVFRLMTAELGTYLQQSPTGTIFLSLSVLVPPQLYYCQSQQTVCTPAHRGCYFDLYLTEHGA